MVRLCRYRGREREGITARSLFGKEGRRRCPIMTASVAGLTWMHTKVGWKGPYQIALRALARVGE
jgi:hypothetical protein